MALWQGARRESWNWYLNRKTTEKLRCWFLVNISKSYVLCEDISCGIWHRKNSIFSLVCSMQMDHIHIINKNIVSELCCLKIFCHLSCFFFSRKQKFFNLIQTFFLCRMLLFASIFAHISNIFVLVRMLFVSLKFIILLSTFCETNGGQFTTTTKEKIGLQKETSSLLNIY